MTPDPGSDGISSPSSLDHRESHDHGPQLDDLVRRLRAWSSASWSHGDRLTTVRRELQQLADDAARAAGRAPATVPELAPNAVPDQLVVLVEQAAEDGVDPAPAVARIAGTLGFTR